MQIILSPEWMLTDEHTASNEGVPVLANRETGEAYGPEDRVLVYPSASWVTAVKAVDMLLGMGRREYTEEEKVFLRAFFLK